MDLLIKSAFIVDPQSPFHSKTKDILIRGGKIVAVGRQIKTPEKCRVFESPNLHVSPGWFDMYASFCDPGLEYKEDLQTGAKAAAWGGFTGVGLKPDTIPPIHSKSEVEYIINKTRGNIVDVYPYGALSYNLDGKNITEMYDMKQAGAIAFSDGDHPVKDAGFMLRCLLYVKPFDGVVITLPIDPSIADILVNEGEMSIILGMKGSPGLAEWLPLHRDIYLARYAKSRIHFSKISTKTSVDMIRKVIKKNANITASVSAYHLLLDERRLNDYNTNYKTNPPLRTKEDIRALIKGISQGVIAAVCSDHNPQDVESKEVEFEYAQHGMINIQTAFAAFHTAVSKHVSLDTMVNCLAINPRKILGLEVPVLAEGVVANLTLFNPEEEWKFEEKDLISKSKNSPFFGSRFTGRALGIVNKNQFFTIKS